MKRWFAVLLCAVLLLAGCSRSQEVSEADMEQPVKFYYCDVGEAYNAETGALAWELHDLGPERLPAAEILRLYLQGPEKNGLQSPFPADQTVKQTALNNGVLTVELGSEFNDLTGVERTLAAACLVQTMTQFVDIEAVALRCDGDGVWEHALTMEDFLLADDTATSDTVSVKLYFADAEGRYLVEETRSHSFLSDAEIPAYILQQLLEGPESASGHGLLAEGIEVLNVQTNGGVCTVNFSESFLQNVPQTHNVARLTILSIVNALTELPEITSVRFLCTGEAILEYGGVDPSEPLDRDELAFGEGRGQEKTADVTLYVPCDSLDLLAAVPVVISRTAGRTLTADVLTTLIAFEARNGYGNPIPDGTMTLASEIKNGTCTVTFSSAFALCDADPAQAQQAVRSVVATLSALEGVERVSILVHNGKLTSVDLSEPLTVEADWLLP